MYGKHISHVTCYKQEILITTCDNIHFITYNTYITIITFDMT